ncbi:MAG: sigma-70 family RNA polymerase sigma factor [Blastocatellia bacterium]|nr:sigma-70 family RNA polymerase sigma factor [Blastocatellia bacterium]
MSVAVGVKSVGGYAEGSMNSSQNLIARIRQGEAEAFRFVFDRYSRPVMSFIFDQVGNRELSEELAQETFVRAYRMIATLRDDTKLSTWLFGIAKNVARESFRTRQRDDHRVELEDSGAAELPDAKLLPDGKLLNKELSQVIQNALAKLDEDKRLIFSLQAFHQYSYEEIAEITGFSIPKIKTDLHRAKAEMRKRIRPYLGDSHEL